MAPPLPPAQADRQRDKMGDLLTVFSKPITEITDEDITQLLDPPRLPSRTPQERLGLAAAYHLNELDLRLLALTDEQLVGIPRSVIDLYRDAMVDDWVRTNRVAAAQRLATANHPAEASPEQLLAWGYDDLFTGPIIRALVSLSAPLSATVSPHRDDTVAVVRPTKQRVVALCADKRSLRQRCVGIVNGIIDAFNIVEYERIRADIVCTASTLRLTAQIEGRDMDWPDGYNPY